MELEVIQDMIYEIRGQKVMLDYDLAKMYGVETKRLNESVRRNIGRFSEDFMFELTNEEYNLLEDSSRSQIATLNKTRGQNIKYAPFAFTEQGVAMLSSVLRSKAAREINRGIMRAFVSVRRILSVMPGIGRDVKEECSEKEARKKIGFNR
ncbi:MAG: ORF6N domain-containing protein [Bacteroidales bacterium]|nr:ORF6N domain-containing protein [Bacteroidales bacterium]